MRTSARFLERAGPPPLFLSSRRFVANSRGGASSTGKRWRTSALQDAGAITFRYFSFVALALLFAGCASPPHDSTAPLHRFQFSSPHMGTLFTMTLYATNRPVAEAAASAAFKRVAALDEIMSDYRADSELMQFCDKSYGQPVRISADLFTILERSQHFARITDGAFDVTIGPFTRLWRFSRKRKTLPAPAEMTAAHAASGWQKLRLDPKNRTATLLVPNMRLDLGGIAKGYAVDEAMKVLRQHGITRALVAGSGDLAIGDAPPGEPGWKVGIAAIDSHSETPLTSVLLHNAGVSTAGDTEQAIEINGVRYSHILDPRTGLGLTNRIQVTLIAPDATTSDGLDTGLAVLGPQKAARVLSKLPHIAAVILTKTDGTNEVVTIRTDKVLKQHTAP